VSITSGNYSLVIKLWGMNSEPKYKVSVTSFSPAKGFLVAEGGEVLWNVV
jgi:hypothetical protein